jgi:hypothetical protein
MLKLEEIYITHYMFDLYYLGNLIKQNSKERHVIRMEFLKNKH